MSIQTLAPNMESFCKLPIRAHIYWKNLKGYYLGSNDLMREKVGVSSATDLLKLTDDDFDIPEVPKWKQEDKLVIQSGRPIQLYNEATLPTGKIKFLTIKTPLFDQDKKIVGVFGFSQYIEETNPPSLSVLPRVGINDFNLTTREHTCLYYLVKGKTAPEIAIALFISKRTIEKHIANIKEKMQCRTKSELIDKAIHCGIYQLGFL